MSIRQSDTAIISAIQSGGKAMDKALSSLYADGAYKLAVQSLVLKFGGNTSDVEDLFQDGLAHLVLNIQKNNFRGESQLKTYFLTICRNIWFQKMRRLNHFNKIKENIDTSDKTASSPEKIYLIEERKRLLQQLVDQIGQPCKQVISLWTLNFSMKEIAIETGYKNQAVARKKKHQCLQALIKLVKNAPSIMQQLKTDHHGAK